MIDDVCTTTHKVDDQMDKLANTSSEASTSMTQELNQLRINSDKSLVLFDAMKQSLESISQPSPGSSATTVSRPSTTPQAPPETKIRKGILFSSSMALDMNKKRFKEELNCDLEIIPTNFVEHQPSTEDPDDYLQGMVKKHLAGRSSYDFAIIATGSQDITQMDTVNSPPTTLYENTSSQAKSIFETAQFMTTDLGIDVFICENPPRYDADTDDPTSMKQNLTKFSNGIMATSTLPAPRIVLIE